MFRWSLFSLIILMALVVGAACYQSVSIVPFWLNDVSMFKNYGHWGINYFPILSPLTTVIWLVTLLTGLKVDMPGKSALYIGHLFFLLIMVATFTYFAPFLLTYMGQPQNTVSDNDLKIMLHSWAVWDSIRQLMGLIPLILFTYGYGKIELASIRKKPSLLTRR